MTIFFIGRSNSVQKACKEYVKKKIHIILYILHREKQLQDFELLENLMNVSRSFKLHDCMCLWFVNQPCEDDAFSKLLFACCQHLRRVMAKNYTMIVNMEALGARGLALDFLDALRKTQERHCVLLENKLARVLVEYLRVFYIAKNLGKTLRTFQPTIRELQAMHTTINVDVKEVSKEFKSTLEKEIGLDDLKNPSQYNTATIPNLSSTPLSVATPEKTSAIQMETATTATTEVPQATTTPLASTNDDTLPAIPAAIREDSLAAATTPADTMTIDPFQMIGSFILLTPRTCAYFEVVNLMCFHALKITAAELSFLYSKEVSKEFKALLKKKLFDDLKNHHSYNQPPIPKFLKHLYLLPTPERTSAIQMETATTATTEVPQGLRHLLLPTNCDTLPGNPCSHQGGFICGEQLLPHHCNRPFDRNLFNLLARREIAPRNAKCLPERQWA
ncbi:sec-independent protein translocase protein TATB, chloroplastic [Artemisia annua]|uniref:Sec-independent protein translocase protein TATB, chloroplastic n=1 Tax=Artemisia annua TaxID=35608 RepID=A0A2U1L3H0_ARTAN|nr:sec-independent protein translocase protein TATB, chloroplastic [Artemisia annua]